MANVWHNKLTVSGKKELLDEFRKEEMKALPFITENGMGVNVEDNDDSIIYYFDTKWGYPIDEIYDSADEYRELTFSLYVFEVMNKQIYCSFTIKDMIYWEGDNDEQGATEDFIRRIDYKTYRKKHPYRKFGK